jgi:hypothetical protein
MSIYARVLEVDASCSISADDDLKLEHEITFSIAFNPTQPSETEPTLSYHRFVQVPTCSPPCKLYVPHRKLLHRSPTVSGVVSSRHTTKSASSMISRQEALFLSLESVVRSWDQILRFSVERTPIAPRATWGEYE